MRRKKNSKFHFGFSDDIFLQTSWSLYEKGVHVCVCKCLRSVSRFGDRRFKCNVRTQRCNSLRTAFEPVPT